ncbi:sn-glycerol-3-phosphate ABC transporter ATP-binding protein UgpC [Neorhizobium lilium]|uniref:sn-glycerol-3-phosphate ABC transporter ATP-binding protein UgpC n=1 Tax=Neorhizobium lilium TaxID=2503024 RepID=A0A3S3S1Z3_9HYPH|nr:sn-glycerol-3-phosphate ABC transporter ATP-binding protein UgpC [Neorhizobium lilium]RWX74723.1 sn-glycerol-3-phosphate ABC transporter ATP-binding protein UgpC [Neorhizobium lilium]
MASMNIVNVGKAYGSLTVIHGVSVEIPDGEFVVLVGPSGCGKSTLLRMVAGLEPITFGDIRIDGKVVNDLPPKDRDIAMVFQSYALYPHKTVAENMGFALKMRGENRSDIDVRVHKAAEILDLTPYLARYPRQLSGGQRQRVAMGRAIVRDPKVFLFDEPLSNLDAKLRVQMRAEIKELQRRLATTMIYVTHDQVEAMTMADRIVVLRDGRVEQIGSPLTLYDKPANTFVASFIGSPSMNLIKGHIRSDVEPYFETDDGIRLPLSRAPAGSDGKPAFYGIRPEHFTLGGTVSAHVTVVESTGSETQVFAKLGQQKIIGVFRDRVEEPSGQAIAMTPNASLVHLFDGGTGLRLD